MQSGSSYHRINGIKLFVHRFRDPDVEASGLTLLLVHGFMDAGATWDLVARRLAAAGHDVIAPDLRGFGQSDPVGPGGYYHFPDYVADLSELCDTIAPRRLGVIGHSMGGTVSAYLVGARPDLAERLALLEGIGPLATPPDLAVVRMQAWLKQLRGETRSSRALTSMQEAVERLCLHHARVPREVIESRAPLLTRIDDRGQLTWAYDPLHRTTSPTPFYVDGFKAFLRNIACPTLVVSGGRLGWHPEGEEERIALLRDATTFELPDAGHMMHWTEPDRLADRLLSFFGGPPPARPAKEGATDSRVR